MRLERVRLETVVVPFRRPFVSGAERWDAVHAGILELTTSDGRVALGELPLPASRAAAPDLGSRLSAALTGLEMADPVAVEGTLRSVDRWPFIGRTVRAAAEAAFADLTAQAYGRPLGRYLKEEAAESVAVNATLGIDSPEATAEAAAGLVGAGYGCLKLKAGDEQPGVLEARVAAVREAAGPSVSLRLDFNGSLRMDGAAEVLTALAPFEIEYAEQPIAAAAAPSVLAALRRASPVPIAADEAVRDLGSARHLLEAGAVDALVVKPVRVGGPRQAVAIIELARQAAVPVTVSTLFETGVGLAVALHVAAIAPGPVAHGLATGGLLASDLLQQPLVVKGGRLQVPAAPGLGVALDEAAVARYRVT